MATILHVIEALSLGGAGRAVIALGKYSSRTAGHKHLIMPLTLDYSDSKAIELAHAEGVQVIAAQTLEEQRQAIDAADIVQVNWWNTPLMQQFCYQNWPASRLVSWCHVAGDRVPQVITPALVNYFDFTVACSPYTYECAAIQNLPTKERLDRTGMAYGATDFARLANYRPKQHRGFRVGFIGTVNFVKMHRNYIAMSARVSVPDVTFVVCGTGGHENVLREEAAQCGLSDRFEIKGYVSDLLPEIETFDLYGYPLCEDTYAAAELNLQEVMYCGICPVVFPYGGIRQLVVNDFTGIIVKSELEYAQAIEHLFHHPQVRLRLGKNAREYAIQIFGAENAAKKFNEFYARILSTEKQTHAWGFDLRKALINQPIPLGQFLEDREDRGTQIFLESLGDQGEQFFTSYRGDGSPETLTQVDTQISGVSEQMRVLGLIAYKNAYPRDRFLRFWTGLALLGSGDSAGAEAEFQEAVRLGLPKSRTVAFSGPLR